MDKDNRNENLPDIESFEKYRHYLDESLNDDVKPQIQKNDDDFEDISSYSHENDSFFMSDDSDALDTEKDEAPRKNKKSDFFRANNYKNTKIIALCVAIVFLLTIAGGLIYIYVFTSGMQYNDKGIHYNSSDDNDYLEEEDHNFKPMGDVDANSLNEYLYSWATSGGEKMYSKNVINVLLCGVDSTTGKADSGRADAMVLISVNKKTEKITMVSFLRDSWTYMKVPRQDGTSYDHYFKMNSAYNYGGPATLLETIENNFKIEIDQFIAVDFKSFPKLIDALGGVTVDVQQYESDFIRRTSKQKDFPVGVSKLNGTQALIYSRIRKSDADSDVSRTRRHRSVIKGLIASAKKATNGQLLNAFKQTSQYMRTGYTQSEVLKLIATAYSHKWMDFEIVELMLPNEDYVDRLSTYVGDQSTWVVDYALCAQKLQKALYGTSNIVLSADRASPLDLVTNRDKYTTPGSDYSSSGGNSSSGGSNNYEKPDYTGGYDEPTDVTEDEPTDVEVTEPPEEETTTRRPIEWPTLFPPENPSDGGEE